MCDSGGRRDGERPSRYYSFFRIFLFYKIILFEFGARISFVHKIKAQCVCHAAKKRTLSRLIPIGCYRLVSTILLQQRKSNSDELNIRITNQKRRGEVEGMEKRTDFRLMRRYLCFPNHAESQLLAVVRTIAQTDPNIQASSSERKYSSSSLSL